MIDDSTNEFTYSKLIDTRALRGDVGFNSNMLDYAFMHSTTFSAILKEDERRVRSVEDGQGRLLYWLLDESSIVKIDDIMPLSGGVGTIMFANRESIAFSEQDLEYPIELDRNPAGGNGCGESTVYNRKNYLLAFKGWSYTGTTQANVGSATLAELQDSTNWSRYLQTKKSSDFSFYKFKVA